MEKFEIFDENGNRTGIIETRETVHARGLWHRTVHIWVYSGSRILLQRRAHDKDSHPGLWDVSAAGHIEVGESPVEAAQREIKEELGIDAEKKDLLYIGTRRFTLVSRKGRFIDREISSVYLYRIEGRTEKLSHDPAEIEELRFYEIDDLKKSIEAEKPEKSFVPHEKSYYMRILELVSERIIPPGSPRDVR